jgi:hypothetical protein
MFLFFVCSFCKADVFDDRYEAGLKEIGSACDKFKENKFYNDHLCAVYKNLKHEASKKGEIIQKEFLEHIPFPNSVAMTGIVLKALIDRKIEIDPHLNTLGRPRLEIKAEEVKLKISYDL